MIKNNFGEGESLTLIHMLFGKNFGGNKIHLGTQTEINIFLCPKYLSYHIIFQSKIHKVKVKIKKIRIT